MATKRDITLIFGPRDVQTYSEVLDYIDKSEMPAATAIKKALYEYVTIYLPLKETLETTNPAVELKKTLKSRKPRKTIKSQPKVVTQQVVNAQDTSEPDDKIQNDDESLFDEEDILADDRGFSKIEELDPVDNVQKGLTDFLGLDDIKLEMP
jgi:hypothetical protein